MIVSMLEHFQHYVRETDSGNSLLMLAVFISNSWLPVQIDARPVYLVVYYKQTYIKLYGEYLKCLSRHEFELNKSNLAASYLSRRVLDRWGGGATHLERLP